MTCEANPIEYEYIVDTPMDGRTLLTVLQSRLKFSRRLLRNEEVRDHIRLNNQPAYLTTRVIEGDHIKLSLPLEQTDVYPEQMDVDVRYEDREVLVVNKAPGILTHPTAKERTGSLLAGVAYYLEKQERVPHAVHRLDRDTSGLILFAKHSHAHHLFDQVLRAGHLHRTYCAIVDHRDAFDRGPLDTWQVIDLPIGQDPNRPSRRTITSHGQRSVTHYRVIADTSSASLVQVILETGRTHQIRVHFTAVGMPLLGDSAYRTMASVDSPAASMERQALHALQLAWRHPVSGEHHAVKAEPPHDMKKLWCDLGGDERVWSTLLNDDTSLPPVRYV